jgi:hypothetical protein
MGRSIERRSEDFSADSVHVAAERSPGDYGLHIAADHGGPTKNREVPRKKRPRRGTTSIPFPQRARIKQHFVAGKNISEIAKIENRHWTTVAKIVRERDVKESVEDLRAKFYGELDNVLIAVMQYVKNGKDGGLLGYRMLVDAGVIPQKNGKHHSAMEPQKPVDPQPDSEQARIRMIATEQSSANDSSLSRCRKWTRRKKGFVADVKKESAKSSALPAIGDDSVAASSSGLFASELFFRNQNS